MLPVATLILPLPPALTPIMPLALFTCRPLSIRRRPFVPETPTVKPPVFHVLPDRTAPSVVDEGTLLTVGQDGAV